jgi:hypothetical protein
MFFTDETPILIQNTNPNNILWEAPPTGLMRHPVIYAIIFICFIVIIWFLYIGQKRRAEIKGMILAKINKVIFLADSPSKRVGLILIVLSLSYLFVMATHWTIYHKEFIYKDWSHLDGESSKTSRRKRRKMG